MYKDPSVKKQLKSRFVTGQTSDQIVKNLLNMSESEGEDDKKIDKEQLRKIEENDTKVDKKAKRRKRLEARDLKEAESGSEIEDEDEEKEEGDKKPESTVKGHAPLKKTPEEIKKSQFLGEKYGHYKIGTYLRITIRLDKKVSRKLEPEYPIVLCSLKQQELGFAFMRVKIKKHRWYPHVLKTRDPVTFSVGWRKFQSIPIFTMEDDSV